MAKSSTRNYHISPAVVAALVKRWNQDPCRAVAVADWSVTVDGQTGRVIGIAAYTPLAVEHATPFNVPASSLVG